MVSVKDAPRTSTTIVIRSDANARITRSRDPYFSLMRRLFQEDATAMRGQKFLMMVEERQKSGNPVKTSEWEDLIKELDVGRASFYSMRNKLLGAGLISNRNNEYRLSGQFSRDLMDLARWWQTAILGENPDDS
ncbi:hypothetical protein HNV12_21410 [Methanococcoides sp. SA1]|uniref:Uncharacterized protein n=1 Tax=Methanococcoides seepicolus TaxID=2828780 RepID=A0A9E5DCT1_9EURY|nr:MULTISPECIES: hypothetical protein [Methanococcoides]NPE30463.1 hypothetical protein [Methanococcoides sp. SA1]MCD4800127.1 hypothetical protein [Methanococcoides sp.]MCD4820749.1 hypothetical protein [Methanococcoides sp.]MCM1987264.1 hypothetical protein [Methanococcoides seepicolus]NOQ47810.1 hypothetical protein [Methanococcoides sp.]